MNWKSLFKLLAMFSLLEVLLAAPPGLLARRGAAHLCLRRLAPPPAPADAGRSLIPADAGGSLIPADAGGSLIPADAGIGPTGCSGSPPWASPARSGE